MTKLFQIDSLDKKILSILMENARTPFLEVARACNISGAAIHQRVQKLEDSGVVKGSKFIVDPKSLGYNTCAFVGVFLEKAHMYKDVVKELKKIPEVVECHFTTGNYAIFLKIYCKDNQHLMNVLNNTIQEIPSVSSTETFISLDMTVDRQLDINKC